MTGTLTDNCIISYIFSSYSTMILNTMRSILSQTRQYDGLFYLIIFPSVLDRLIINIY